MSVIEREWIERVQAVVDEAHRDNLGGEHVNGFCKACAAAYLVAQIAVPQQPRGAVDAARKVLQDHEITDLEDGGRVYVDALALAELRDAIRSIGGR